MSEVRLTTLVSLLFLAAPPAMADSLGALSEQFWQWRAVEQPFTADDIPRIERPADLLVDWSAATVDRRRLELAAFDQRYRALAPPPAAPIELKVDYHLLGSALSRVHWELEVVRTWRRDPRFYLDQTLGSIFVLLTPPPPFSEARQDELIARLRRFPQTLADARQNLTEMRAPFVGLAVMHSPKSARS